MKRTLQFFAVFVIAVIFFGCQPSREKMISKIQKLETELTKPTDINYDKSKVEKLSAYYRDFVKRFPSDTLCPYYLYKTADLAVNTGEAKKAIEYLNQIEKDYPQFRELVQVMFFKAFIYEDKLKDIVSAEKAYKDLIVKFPNSELAESAKLCIQNLGIPPDELVRRFEAQNQAKLDSLAKADK